MYTNSIIPLIENNVSFSPYYFYKVFLKRVSSYYKENPSNRELCYRLIEDSDPMFGRYYIDPISLPLLLSLSQQLSKSQGDPINLYLSNTPSTISVIEFLYYSDFFHVAGDNINPTFPIGKNILNFNKAYIGGFTSKHIRSEHKIRCYALDDDLFLMNMIASIKEEEAKRDYLVEYYTFKVREHFGTLLYEKEVTNELANEFVMILSELITNGVIHSQANTFALMFSDRYKTKFSISDNGIGLWASLSNKREGNFYKKFELANIIQKNLPFHTNPNITRSLLSIFETLYYSMLKNRHGLFDLMCNVVVDTNGYFRIHNDYCQIIISSRMINELIPLYELRKKIVEIHNRYSFNIISLSEFNNSMTLFTEQGKYEFQNLVNTILRKFSEDTRFSAIRIFDVKFRGVHIEVEIPT